MLYHHITSTSGSTTDWVGHSIAALHMSKVPGTDCQVPRQGKVALQSGSVNLTRWHIRWNLTRWDIAWKHYS